MQQLRYDQPTKVEEIGHELMVRDVMTDEVITVDPGLRVRDLREVLRRNRISGLPVVEDGSLVGIISLEDFIKCLAERDNGCRVGEKMTREVVTLFADDPLVRAIARFETSGGSASSGSIPSTRETRSRTSLAAPSMSRSRENSIVTADRSS